MVTSKMALRKMREICWSLPGSVETEHFGESCFCVGKKIFASCGEKSGVVRIVVQLEPQHASRLVAGDPRFRPYGGRQKACVALDAAGVKDWDEVRALVLESYRLNVPIETGAPRASSNKRRTVKKAPRKLA